MVNLPEPRSRARAVADPALFRAAVSPSAIAVTAAGVGIGVLDRSGVLAAVLGVVAWSGRMVAAAVSSRRRSRALNPHPAVLDPWSVPEPWRQLLQQAMSAQTRFDQAVAGWPPGPTRDRLAELQPRLYQEVEQLGAMARQGAAASAGPGGAGARSRPSQDALSQELRQLQAQRARLGDIPAERVTELARREEAVAAQLRALYAARRAVDEIHDTLRLAVARLDQTVTELVTAEPSGPPVGLAGMASALDQLSDGVSSLRAALNETAGTPPDSGTP